MKKTAKRTTPRRAARRSTSWLTWIERGLWCFALVCLSWVAWVYSDAFYYQSWAEGVFADATSRPAAAAGAAPRSFAPEPGAPVARVRVPRLGLSVVVAEGTTTQVLRRAVGRLSDSAAPGSDGNVVLAAHRDSYFRPLEAIAVGDRVILDAAAGSDEYVVEWTRVVEPSDVEVAAPTDYPALTLITCYPFRYVGTAPQRFVVRARRGAGAAVATSQEPPPPPETTAAPWNGDAS